MGVADRALACAVCRSGYACSVRRTSEGPGTFFWQGPRAFSAAAPRRTLAPCLYARDARRCPVPTGSCMGPADHSPRLYNCQRCGLQVHICRQCDRGNLYCTMGCAPIRRRESVQRARARYQRTYRGACRHAARQSEWRARQRKEVTHQGSPEPGWLSQYLLMHRMNRASRPVNPFQPCHHRLWWTNPPPLHRGPAVACASACSRYLLDWNSCVAGVEGGRR